jgi:hypothetical protein
MRAETRAFRKRVFRVRIDTLPKGPRFFLYLIKPRTVKLNHENTG